MTNADDYALRLINRHRSLYGQRLLDPQAADWTSDDLAAEARRLAREYGYEWDPPKPPPSSEDTQTVPVAKYDPDNITYTIGGVTYKWPPNISNSTGFSIIGGQTLTFTLDAPTTRCWLVEDDGCTHTVKAESADAALEVAAKHFAAPSPGYVPVRELPPEDMERIQVYDENTDAIVSLRSLYDAAPGRAYLSWRDY